MNIYINAAAAFKHPRTGVEEYAYQIIKHLAMLEESRKHRFILYAPQIYTDKEHRFTQMSLPENFEIRELKTPFMRTQLGLSWEMLKKFRVNPRFGPRKSAISASEASGYALFTPAHVLPIIHPKNSVVTIHGLEYEYYPEMYPPFHRKYLRWSTKYALKHARKIIAASENTKQDLIKLYGGDPKKIKVIYHGVNVRDLPLDSPDILCRVRSGDNNLAPERSPEQSRGTESKAYILYIGRIEKKKNIIGIIKAFEILKKQHQIPHKLVLAGPAGFGFQGIKRCLDNLDNPSEIKLTGYVSEKEKWGLFRNADVFIFPSFYEGFGFPVLEAQRVGVPVVASNVSSFPEILKSSALLVSPQKSEEIAEAIYSLISNKTLRQSFIWKGYENVRRFSWEKCARETLRILLEC